MEALGFSGFSIDGSAKEMYDNVLNDIFEEAKSLGWIHTQITNIPEDNMFAEQVAIDFYQDEEFRVFMKDFPEQWYAAANRHTLFFGMVAAKEWFHNRKLPKITHAITPYETSVERIACDLAKEYICSEMRDWRQLLKDMSKSWFKWMEPTWEMPDNRVYCIVATAAYYRLGFSMIWEKLNASS